jgi:esterase/lipase
MKGILENKDMLKKKKKTTMLGSCWRSLSRKWYDKIYTLGFFLGGVLSLEYGLEGTNP